MGTWCAPESLKCRGMGETGRLPLIYESIRLTLNYFRRIRSHDPKSFVSAALREQESMNLPWYKNLKPLLKLDEIYSLDHVTAYQTMKGNTKINNHPNPSSTHRSRNLLQNTSTIIKPLQSEKCRTNTVINTLTDHFKQCWENCKSTSPKLSFYHSCKSNFTREPYLDVCKGFSRRCSTTKLRISSHDLEIEHGRYQNKPREDRICEWCKTSIGINVIENECHMLFDCDLYHEQRSKFLNNLKKNSTCHKLRNCRY